MEDVDDTFMISEVHLDGGETIQIDKKINTLESKEWILKKSLEEVKKLREVKINVNISDISKCINCTADNAEINSTSSSRRLVSLYFSVA